LDRNDLSKYKNELPRNKTVILISYSSNSDTSYVAINNRNYDIPENINSKSFIEEKTKNLSGIITCVLYLSGNKL
jgi:hypothetical protein